MKTTTEIKTYPDDDHTATIIKVVSHWNEGQKVVLVINEKEHIVLAVELKKAIDRATNY